MNRIASTIKGLPPNYFAMVMATGIVSIACHLTGFQSLAVPMLWLNVVFYLVLCTLTISRIVRYPRNFFSDLCNHQIAPQYLTIVAGTCVLGSQFVILTDNYQLGLGLLTFGASVWFVLIYGILSSLAVAPKKPPLGEAINGSWLLATVSTESISVLAGRLIPTVPDHHTVVLFLCLCLFLIGGIFYLIVITVIFYRILFVELRPDQFTPPYWINMGAVAITSLAGAILAGNSQDCFFLEPLRPFVAGLTVSCWAVATWWIPFLLAMGVWRRVLGGIKFAYTPLYWSVVFPLGMYTTCTAYVGDMLGLEFLLQISRYFIYVALAAWGLTCLGLMRTIARGGCKTS